MIEKLLAIDQGWMIKVNNFANSSSAWQTIFKFIAVYCIYLIPIILVILWFWQASAKKVALRATLAGLISWLVIANIIGRLLNRPRPFEVVEIKEFLFHRPTYSFPSDHIAFLIAVAFSFWLSGYKKLAWFVLAGTIIISLARIGTGFHYPSDIFASVVLGVIVAWFVWLFDKPLNYIYNFVITLARKLGLG